ncbi:MAG: biotin-dependent carboxyltransferase family protein [Clostridia bacterium]|nr:biotin-dependent carboxyltransferase family protein [Clostridia bacterium]
MIKVISPGLLTTLQDGGRYGYQQFGVPVCGAMDRYSLNLANMLAGNDPDEGALEITYMGPTLRFDSGCTFALCGGRFEARLDGQPLEMARAYAAAPGSTLEIGAVKEGFRGYLAISGGFAVEPVLGSRSTYLKGGFGGLHGRKLQKDDELPLRNPSLWLPFMDQRVYEADTWRYPLEKRAVRVVLGPQEERFSAKGIETFLSSEYTVTQESDRMGYRLDGQAIEYAEGCDGNIISDGIVMGAVQVPSGKPIIMMADRQTTGGYSKIATVITADLPLLAQMQAGGKVCFAVVTPQEAARIRRKQQGFLRRLEF